jgi:hypothetical protein
MWAGTGYKQISGVDNGGEGGKVVIFAAIINNVNISR